MQASERRRIGPFRVVKRSIQEFVEDDMTVYAAALSYTLLFSLFPFVIFVLALLGMLNIPGFFDWLLQQSRVVLPGQASGLIENVINQVRSQAAGGVLSFGAVLALYSASAAVRMTMHAMNVAYDIEQERPIWKKFPLSILYTVLLAVLLIAAVALMLMGQQVVSWLAGQIGLGSLFVTLWTWLRIPVAIVLLTVAVALINYLFPNHNEPFRFITPGAVISVIVWILASLGFSYYVSNFSSYSATYGSIAAIIVLLLYFFISGAVLLRGAEVNAEGYRQVTEDGSEGDESVTS